MRWRELALAGGMFAGVIAWGACSSSPSASPPATSCESDPTQCPAGTTCWPADAVPNLRCLPSEPGSGFGAACVQRIGQATCADGLACDQEGPASGSCTYYCGAAGPACPTGYECRMTNVGSGPSAPAIDVCRAGTALGDGGAMPDDSGGFDAAPGSSDAASDAPPNKQ